MQNNYRLIIKNRKTGEMITTVSALRIQAVIEAGGVYGNIGYSTINIYNLSKKTQTLLINDMRNAYSSLNDSTTDSDGIYDVLLFYVDGEREELVYGGVIYFSETTLGDSDVVTTLSTTPIPDNNPQIFSTVAKGEGYQSVLKTIAKAIDPKLKVKADCLDNLAFAKSRTLSGSAFQNIKDILRNKGFAFYYNYDGLVVYKPGTKGGSPIEVSMDTGMIEIPSIGRYYVSVEMVSNPNIQLRDTIKLMSSYEDEVAGLYEVFEMSHNVDNFMDGWTTELRLRPAKGGS